MHIFFIVIVSLGIIVGSFYINTFFKRLFAFFSLKKPKVFNVLYILLVFALLISTYFNSLGTATIVFGYFLLFCILFDLLGLAYRKRFSTNKIVKCLYSGGIPAIFLTAAVMILGALNGYHVVATPYTVYTDKHVPNSSLNIVYIADIHMGVSINMDNIAAYCLEIENQNPDIVLIGGDLFDERTTSEEVEVASRHLGDISSKYGTYFVWGNHEGDVEAVSETQQDNVDFQRNSIEQNGIRILEDEVVLIDDSFYVVGRWDAGVGIAPTPAETLLAELDKEKPIFVLEHKPIDVESMATLGVDLYLCGHTHGGQIPPIGFFESFIYDGVYGLEKVGNCTMIITSGMGTWNSPIRLGSVSEYVLIDFTMQ